jgi:predicted nuclease of predicted toxin-antitoxin system
VKIVVDMNLSQDWIGFLEIHGHDATHWARIGPADSTDETIAEWAADRDAVLLTNDLDFGHIHALAGSSRPSVIQLRSPDLRPESIGDIVSKALVTTAKSLSSGAIVTVSPPHVRIRTLPIV